MCALAPHPTTEGSHPCQPREQGQLERQSQQHSQGRQAADDHVVHPAAALADVVHREEVHAHGDREMKNDQ